MTEYSTCVCWTFAVFVYFVWGGWIYCCTLGSLWTLDLIKYGSFECIHLDDSIPISLISIADFNALIFICSLLIFCLEWESVYMPLFCSAIATSVAQFGLHITLFVYVNDAYWLDSYADCDIVEEIINVAYYYLLAGITIISLSACFPCIIAMIMACGCCCEDMRFPNFINAFGVFGNERSEVDHSQITDETDIELLPIRDNTLRQQYSDSD